MGRRDPAPEEPTKFGIDAEIERLLRCPECGSSAVRPVLGGYGFFGLKALGDFGSPRDVRCQGCGAQWARAPMRELRREAQRRIDERYDALDVENERLRSQLSAFLDANPPTVAGEIPARDETTSGSAAPSALPQEATSPGSDAPAPVDRVGN